MSYVNLIPDCVVVGRIRRRRLVAWSGVLVAAVATLAVILAAIHDRVGAQRVRVADLAALRQEMQTQVERTVQLQGEQEKLAAREAVIGALVAGEDWPRDLAAVARQCGDTVWLERLELAPTAVAQNAATGQGSGLRVQGSGLREGPYPNAAAGGGGADASGYRVSISGIVGSHRELSVWLSRLTQAGVFRSVDLRVSRTEPFLGGTAVRFEVTCAPCGQGREARTWRTSD